MIFIIAIFFMLAAILAVISNPDVLSPAKFFLFFFLAFHIGVIFVPVSVTTGALIFVVLCIGIVATALETFRSTPAVPSARSVAKPSKQRDYSYFLWGLSLIPIVTQLYMIQHFGGLEGYFRSISLRVVEWAGFGWARTLIAFLVPINLAYFAIGLRQRRPIRWWVPYGAHFLLLVGMGLLAGSRSILLNVFIIQLIAYNYLRTRVSGQTAGLLAAGLILAAMTLGVLRNIVRFQDGTFSAAGASTERASGFASFYYGVDPLEIIVSTEHPVLAKGSTFFSLFTNMIPRSLWPNKPDTGGVFFTKNYVGDIWLGYSNQTPTFLGEWIINFGWAIGIIGYFVSYGIIIFFIYKGYRYILDRLRSSSTDTLAIDTVIYGCVMLTFVGLMVGELTNVAVTLLTTQLLPLWGIRWYVNRKRPA